MRPGGRVACCVQQGLEDNPMLEAQAAALDAHVGAEAGNAVRAICSLPDGREIRRMFEDAGFEAIKVRSTTLTLTHPDARAFAQGAMGGMHTGDKLSGLTNQDIERAIKAFLDGLEDYRDGPMLRFPHTSNVVTARA